MQNLKLMLSIACISIAPNLFAQNASDDLITLLTPIRTINSQFTQENLDKSSHPITSSKGNLVLERPGKFRWEIKKPNPQTIVSNGTKLWIYDPDLEQVTIRTLSKETGDAPALLLSNPSTTLRTSYNVQTLVNTADKQEFLLTPRDKNSLFEHIKMRFNKKMIEEMQLEDHLGHITSITFNNVILNQSVSPSLFTFKTPPNVDVINETNK